MSNKTKLIRKFNQDYFNRLNIFNSNNNFSVTETRIFYELSIHDKITLKEISDVLHIDLGYASRIIKKHTAKGHVIKVSINNEKRAKYISLTTEGEKIVDEMNKSENQRINSLLEKLDSDSQTKLINAIDTVYSCLNPKKKLTK